VEPSVKHLKDGLTAGLVWSVALGLVLFAGVPGLRAQEKSFLWKVRSERNSLHILGSIHFLRRNDYPLRKVIEEAFAHAKQLVLEVDLSSVNRGKIQQLTLEKGVLQNGATLQQSISPETYELAEKRARELGLDIRAMDSLKPWVAALTLAAMKLRKLGFDPDVGVDRYFADRAKQEEKPVQGLETPEFQIGLFGQFSRHDQELMLLQTLKEMDLLEHSVERIMNAWKDGDVAAMEKLMLASMREYPEVRQKLIDDRNRRWVPQLEQLLSGGERVLVIVGAAHLVGPTGVIELLKRRGYRVEQL
jgi:uncharacterized protein YbaP (TraB family)